MTRRTPLVLVSFVLLSALVRPMAAQAPSEIYRPGPDIVNPVLLKEVKPNYTPEGTRRGIEGVVYLEAVIMPNGTVWEARVTKSLDAASGLDTEAVRAVRQWMFKPATRNGQPVAVFVSLEVAFRLSSQFGRGAHRSFETGLVMPVVVREVKPNYTPAAMREKLQGSAAVDVVVGADGTVTEARLFQSVDKTFGLDDEAMKSARQWTFKPGTLNGQAVPVITTIHLDFRLH